MYDFLNNSNISSIIDTVHPSIIGKNTTTMLKAVSFIACIYATTVPCGYKLKVFEEYVTITTVNVLREREQNRLGVMDIDALTDRYSLGAKLALHLPI